jgi:hypothetical protein
MKYNGFTELTDFKTTNIRQLIFFKYFFLRKSVVLLNGAQVIDINMDEGLLDSKMEMTKFLNLIYD